MRTMLPIWLLAGALAAPAALAHEGHRHGAPGPTAAASCAADEVSLRCAAAATPTIGPDGALWLAWVAGGRVAVARTAADDPTGPLGEPAVVSPAPARIDDNGDGRPVIAVAPDGRVTIAYAVRKDERYNGQVLVSSAADGRSFAPPAPLRPEGSSERFPVLAADPAGRLLALWIDKAPAAAAKRDGRPYDGAALLAAWSEDGGARFGPPAVLGDNSCECCRIAVAWAGPGRPAVAWRSLFPDGVRDHALLVFAGPGDPGPRHRPAVDGWRIDACPHHGPALAAAGGTLHLAWYTEGERRQGLFYARSRDGGASFTEPMPVGDPQSQPGHAQIAAVGDTVWLVWKSFDGQRSRVMAMRSADGGASWGGAVAVAETADASDHPLLVTDRRGRVLLSWQTRAEGYRLLPLPGDAP